MEFRMAKAFDLRGGVLCDPVGSGKTATALGLVLADRAAGASRASALAVGQCAY